MTQTRKHRLNDLPLTRLQQRHFHYISPHLPKSLKQIMQCDSSSMLMNDDQPRAISWRGDAILAKISWKTYPMELAWN